MEDNLIIYNSYDLSWEIYTPEQLRTAIDANTQYEYHTGFKASYLSEAGAKYNINAILIFSIGQLETNGGTSKKGAETKNPGNIGNLNTGEKRYFDSFKLGWLAIGEEIRRRINNYSIKSIYNLAGLDNAGNLSFSFPVWATKWAYYPKNKKDEYGNEVSDEEERKHRKKWADDNIVIMNKIESKIPPKQATKAVGSIYLYDNGSISLKVI